MASVLQHGPENTEFPFSRRREVNQSFSKNIPFPATPNVENKFCSSRETLESTFLYIVVFLGTFKVIFSSSLRKTFLPLTNRVRGPYCKFRTELFPHRFMYGPIAQRAGHKSNGKTSLGFGNNFYSRRTALNF